MIADAQRSRAVPCRCGARASPAALGIAALFPWFLLWASGKFNEPDEVETTPLALAVAFGVRRGVLTFVGARIAASDRQRGTSEGMEAGSRWLGVRAYLERDGDVPRPAARARGAVGPLPRVCRRLRRGAGVHPRAADGRRARPAGVEQLRGTWRQVKVRYGRLLAAGVGHVARRSRILRGLFFGGIAGVITYVLLVDVDPLDADQRHRRRQPVSSAWAVLGVG